MRGKLNGVFLPVHLQRLPHPVYHQFLYLLLRRVRHLLGGRLHGGATEERGFRSGCLRFVPCIIRKKKIKLKK